VAALRKYDEQTRARALRMYEDRIRDLGESKVAATASAFFAQAELDRRLK